MFKCSSNKVSVVGLLKWLCRKSFKNPDEIKNVIWKHLYTCVLQGTSKCFHQGCFQGLSSSYVGVFVPGMSSRGVIQVCPRGLIQKCPSEASLCLPPGVPSRGVIWGVLYGCTPEESFRGAKESMCVLQGRPPVVFSGGFLQWISFRSILGCLPRMSTRGVFPRCPREVSSRGVSACPPEVSSMGVLRGCPSWVSSRGVLVCPPGASSRSVPVYPPGATSRGVPVCPPGASIINPLTLSDKN
jgi:hypothetical protein